ncbi:unnamed protein product [Prunus brigantina]
MEIVEEALDVSEKSVPITVDVESLPEEASVKSVEVRGNVGSHHQPPTPSVVVGTREENVSFASKLVSKSTKFFEHKGWVEENQGMLLLLSSMIAIICFRNLFNPPGGLRQQTTTNADDGDCSIERPCLAGTALLGNSRWSSYIYSYFGMFNMICFCTCQTINFLICSGFPAKHRIFMFILLMLMCACLILVSIMFILLTWLVMPEGICHEALFSIITWLRVWFVMILVIFAFHVIRVAIWCVKTVKGCKTNEGGNEGAMKVAMKAKPVTIVVGSQIWVENPELVWIDGEVINIKGEDAEIQVVAKVSKIYPKDMESPAGGVDLTKLSYLLEPGVLCNLATRYENNGIYSNPVLEAFGNAKTVRITIPAALGNLSRFNLINVEAIFSVCFVASILHLGNIDFANGEDNDSSVLKNDESLFHLQMTAELLMCNPRALKDALCKRVMVTPEEIIKISLDPHGATVSRDGLAKTIYSRLFDWLVDKINVSIGQDPSSKCLIGVLDIYCFESFKTNSFEQFCIIYTNEKLQQHFNKQVFKSEQEEYTREEIDWSYIEFVDNKDVLDVIEQVFLPSLSLSLSPSNVFSCELLFCKVNAQSHKGSSLFWQLQPQNVNKGFHISPTFCKCMCASPNPLHKSHHGFFIFLYCWTMEIVEEVLDMSEEFVPIIVDVENLSEEASVKSMKVRGNIESHHQPPTPSVVVTNREENASFESKFERKLTKFFEHKA